MVHIDNRSNLDLDFGIIKSIASSLSDRDIELIITNNSEISKLNTAHRGKKSATDVLSFPIDEVVPNMPLGSIVISADYIQNGAKEFGHTIDDELALLFVHGLLHLLGYDHEKDNGEMRQEEAKIIKKFSLPQSLIVRVEENN